MVHKMCKFSTLGAGYIQGAYYVQTVQYVSLQYPSTHDLYRFKDDAHLYCV